MKGFETGVCQNRQWRHCRLTLIDSDILNKKVSDLPKSMFWLKTRTFIYMIYFLLEQLIRYHKYILIAYGRQNW